uniref:Uncharacterized protein n=1 Tax=Tanacetum cinerariifolium TaxID=118510 RepID=A0A6L2L614_TANCI|nr:hypothetical protein [Tanacetum cinerariifolium]
MRLKERKSIKSEEYVVFPGLPGCLFVVGVSAGGSGSGLRVVEWQENGERWGCRELAGNLVNRDTFEVGGKEYCYSFWVFTKLVPVVCKDFH